MLNTLTECVRKTAKINMHAASRPHAANTKAGLSCRIFLTSHSRGATSQMISCIGLPGAAATLAEIRASWSSRLWNCSGVFGHGVSSGRTTTMTLGKQLAFRHAGGTVALFQQKSFAQLTSLRPSSKEQGRRRWFSTFVKFVPFLFQGPVELECLHSNTPQTTFFSLRSYLRLKWE